MTTDHEAAMNKSGYHFSYECDRCRSKQVVQAKSYTDTMDDASAVLLREHGWWSDDTKPGGFYLCCECVDVLKVALNAEGP